MAAQTNIVNLLPADRFEFSPLGRFLVWALSTGRSVVVLTELVIIVAFLSRFWFDWKLADLRKLTMTRAASAQQMEDVRIKWERFLFLAEEIYKVNGNNFDAAERLAKIQELTPAGVEFDSIEISSRSMSLRGYVSGSDVFSRLFSRFKAEKSYAGVTIGKLEQSSRRSPGFDFDMEVRDRGSGFRDQPEE